MPRATSAVISRRASVQNSPPGQPSPPPEDHDADGHHFGLNVRRLDPIEGDRLLHQRQATRTRKERDQAIVEWKRTIAATNPTPGMILQLTPHEPLPRQMFQQDVRTALEELGFVEKPEWVFVGETSMVVRLPKRRRGRIKSLD